jgi:hypothetical protein
MSNIRLFGLAIAVLALLATLFYFRGKRLHRANWATPIVACLSLAIVAIHPGVLNALRDLFDLEGPEHGRLLALLVVSNIAALFLTLYVKGKSDLLKHQVDRIFCGLAADSLMPADAAQRMKEITIVIPALNEAENLKMLLPRIPRQIRGREVGIIVVDDGSTDDTTQVALDHGCLVARSPVNRGQGAASRIGYRVLRLHGAEIGVTMDADNQHRPEDIEPMLAPVLEDRLDLVVGSRILGSRDQDSIVRFAGVHLFSALVSFITGTRITDCSSGFKAFRMARMGQLNLREDQFQASEVLIEAARKGLRIGEVPIHVALRSVGPSRKGGNLTYGLFFLKTLTKSWLR